MHVGPSRTRHELQASRPTWLAVYLLIQAAIENRKGVGPNGTQREPGDGWTGILLFDAEAPDIALCKAAQTRATHYL